jgi:hypothetical protein
MVQGIAARSHRLRVGDGLASWRDHARDEIIGIRQYRFASAPATARRATISILTAAGWRKDMGVVAGTASATRSRSAQWKGGRRTSAEWWSLHHGYSLRYVLLLPMLRLPEKYWQQHKITTALPQAAGSRPDRHPDRRSATSADFCAGSRAPCAPLAARPPAQPGQTASTLPR